MTPNNTDTPTPDDDEAQGVVDADVGEETDELLEEIENKRSLQGGAAIALAAVAVGFSAFQMYIAARTFTFPWVAVDSTFTYGVVPVDLDVRVVSRQLQRLQVNLIHVTFALVLSFLLYPTSTGDGMLSRRLAHVCDAATAQLGPENPVTRAVERSETPSAGPPSTTNGGG